MMTNLIDKMPKNNKRFTPIREAARHKHYDIVDYILSEIPDSFTDIMIESKNSKIPDSIMGGLPYYLKIMKVQMGSNSGDGMDGGLWGVKKFGTKLDSYVKVWVF